MTTPALPAGPIRRRVLFGLLDGEGWGWASLKAVFWFVVMIFVLGYIPDRAYYFTVNRTLDLGILAWSPVNFCPPENETLPCPAPSGSIRPWHPSTAPALPAPRTGGGAVQVTTTVLYIGGSDGQTAQSTVYASTIENGAIGAWSDGPALPAPRTEASIAFYGGSVYVIGGLDADGAPTTTTFVLTPDAATGDLGDWATSAELGLPEALAGAAIGVLGDGLLLIGGDNGSGPTDGTWKAPLDSQTGALGGWAAEPGRLAVATTGGHAFQIGDGVWLYGGRDGSGATPFVQVGALMTDDAGVQALAVWRVQGPGDPMNLPEGRESVAAWIANGVLYAAGGSDGTAPRPELWWAAPTAGGIIAEWHHLPQTDLPTGLAGAAALPSGSEIFLIGGTTDQGVLGQLTQANLAPQAPFFQVGLVGATVPALKIDGEIGQQLGYLNAAGAGTGGFIALVIVGWAMAHRDRTRAFLGRFRRR